MSVSDVKHRFFAESVAGPAVELPAGEAHHALHVMRLTGGDLVEAFDGSGEIVTGPLRPAGRRAARVEVTARRSAEPPPGPAIELAFAVPKGRRLDWLLEKGTELAACTFAPVVFERSVVRPEMSASTRRRWRLTCIAAAKQCGAGFLPRIADPRPLAGYLAGADASVHMLGDAAGESMAGAAGDLPRAEGVAVLVGPEGGLTAAERDAAVAAGFAPVRVGEYTLRVETAAVALLAAVRAMGQAGPLQLAPGR